MFKQGVLSALERVWDELEEKIPDSDWLEYMSFEDLEASSNESKD